MPAINGLISRRRIHNLGPSIPHGRRVVNPRTINVTPDGIVLASSEMLDNAEQARENIAIYRHLSSTSNT